jgi:hypothetical protein
VGGAARRSRLERPGRKGEYANELLTGFNGTIQVDVYGGYTHLAKPNRKGGVPMKLAFCWAHGRCKLIKATPQKGSPIVDDDVGAHRGAVQDRGCHPRVSA